MNTLPAGPRPLRRLLAGALIGLVGALIGLLAWGGLHAGLEATSTEAFCVSCHEMQAGPGDEYRKSIHFRNAAGVRAVCADCHVPRATGPKLLAKLRAAGEVWAHLTGTIATPETFEAARLRMAKSVWAEMTATDSRECRDCHAYDAMDFHKQRPDAQAQMPKAAEKGETCISCHKGIAHKLPDMATGIRQAFDDIAATAAHEGARADTLWSIATKPIWLDRPATADAPADGRLLAASRVDVLARAGDWLQVRIAGWQQEGAERVFYALQGQRIFVAALGAAAVDKVTQGDAITDKDTDLVWHHATLVAWVGKDALIADRKTLDAYGSELYGDACGTCHAPHPPDYQLANQWIGTIADMKARTTLDEEQLRFVQKYLQLRARDTAGRGE